MRTADLMLRYAIIIAAWHLGCAWIQTFQEPWPLVDAFELADNAEEQLFKSLGICFDADCFGCAARQLLVLIHVTIVNRVPRKAISTVYLTCVPRHSSGVGGCFSS